MKNYFKIRDRQGERNVAEEDFPIVIGGGPNADIRVDGLGERQEAAYIGLSEGKPFVQAAETGIAVNYNQAELKGSVWLSPARRRSW